MKYEEFECIYQEYCLKILTFIHKRVPDLYEAEELTGDVFLSFYRNMDSYDEEKGSIAKCKDDTETCSGEVANDYGKTGGIGVQATETLPELTGDNAL